MLDRRIEIAAANIRRVWACSLQQIRQDLIDLRNLVAHFLDDGPSRTGGGQIAPDDFNYASNPRQRIANFMGQTGREFSESGQVFGTRHLRAEASQSLRESRGGE